MDMSVSWASGNEREPAGFRPTKDVPDKELSETTQEKQTNKQKTKQNKKPKPLELFPPGRAAALA